MRRYLLAAAALAVVVAVLMAVTGSYPRTWLEWLGTAALVPAGVAGALIGDRIGLWLKDHGIGRQ